MSALSEMSGNDAPRLSHDELRDALVGAGLANGILEGRINGTADEARAMLRQAARGIMQIHHDLESRSAHTDRMNHVTRKLRAARSRQLEHV
ncbi:hypothetical protein [Kozakia baliensis]|uniref:hypothetical protein n=1 Tax=Kozakia baliensis TaxID=153496 RepID=UPI0004973829|nr:hypothetical protein [Kozakia baliensis]